jgi:cysteine desulfurase / selenocysteine lyase
LHPNVYCIPAALSLLEGVGYAAVAEHIQSLSRALIEGARNLEIEIKTPLDSVGPLVVLRMKDAEAMVQKMAANNIVVSNRMDGLRLSFHLYNTFNEVGAVLDLLKQNLDLVVHA